MTGSVWDLLPLFLVNVSASCHLVNLPDCPAVIDLVITLAEELWFVHADKNDPGVANITLQIPLALLGTDSARRLIPQTLIPRLLHTCP